MKPKLSGSLSLSTSSTELGEQRGSVCFRGRTGGGEDVVVVAAGV